MPVRFPTALQVWIMTLFTMGSVLAQPTVKNLDYIPQYTVSLTDSPLWFRTPQGQPMSFRSLPALISQPHNGLLVEALNLDANAVRSTDWHHLRQLRSLRRLAIYVPDTTQLILDSLLLNLAQLPRLQALHITFQHPELPQRRRRRNADITQQRPTLPMPQPPGPPVTGFTPLEELRLSGDKIPAYILISRFSGHPGLQRLELRDNWQTPLKALPDNLSHLPNLTQLRVTGRGWQGWESAFRGLSKLRCLSLFMVSAGGPRARSQQMSNLQLSALEEAHVADLNRGLAHLSGLQQLDLTLVTQVERLRLGNLPALTRLRLQQVTPGDTTFLGLKTLHALLFEGCLMPSLPATVCELSQLTELRLDPRSYSGGSEGGVTQLPACLSQLESLTTLSLVNNPLGHLPFQAGDLPRLKHLDLENCQLDTLPGFIAALRMLRYLNVSRNRVSFLPDAIPAWKQLDTLLLGHNRLTRLPNFITRLGQLRVLGVDGNQLQRLPDQLGDLHALRQLSIENNALKGLPSSMSRLRQLQSLTLGKSSIPELPSWLGRLEQLTKLACDMPLTTLPSSLVHLKQLTSVRLRNTRLLAVPNWISAWRKLKHFGLESDALRSLPESLGRLTNLETLSIRGKMFSRLPHRLGQLCKLTNLSVQGGALEGDASSGGHLTRLPASVVHCQKLYGLRLTHQPRIALEPLFKQLSQLPTLGTVDMTADNIHRLPPMNWSSLGWHALTLTQNKLSVPPKELAQLPYLQMLDLRGNSLPESLNRSFPNHTMIQEAFK